MHKKDYELLTQTIRTFLDDYDEEIDKVTIRKFVTRLSRILKSDNPNFDRQKFIEAIYPDNSQNNLIDYPNAPIQDPWDGRYINDLMDEMGH